MEALLIAVTLGLAAGLTPGPLLTLVMSSTLARGFGAGLRVALAPLIADLPIVAIVLLALRSAPAWMLSVLALAGGVVLMVLAVRTWTGADSAKDQVQAASGAALVVDHGPRDVARGAMVNFLNPHPWVAWSTVLGPQIVALWSRSYALAVLFVALFYVFLVGTLILIAAGVAHGRHRIGGTGHLLALRACAFLLAAFGALLLIRGVSLLELGVS